MAADSIHRRLFWPVYAPSILFGVAAGATVPVMVIALVHLGAPPALAALAIAVQGAIGLATTIPAGRLIDRWGDRRAMLVATVLGSAFGLAEIAALVWGGHNPTRLPLLLFVLVSFLRAPVGNVWGLARQAYTAEVSAVHERGRAMTALGGTMRVGNLVGPLLGGLLLLRWPLWSSFALSVACSLLAVGVLYVAHEEALPTRAPAGATVAPGTTGANGATEASVPVAVDWTRVVLAGIAITTLAVARADQPVLLQLWGIHQGLGESTVSLLTSAGAAVEVVLMFPGGYLKDRLGRARILVICLLVYGSGFLLMVPASHLWGLAGMVASVVVMALGNGLGAGVNMTIGADLSSEQNRGRFLGTWALFTGAGALGGPMLVSALVGLTSVAAAVAAVGGVAVAGAAWTVVFARRMALPRGVRR